MSGPRRPTILVLALDPLDSDLELSSSSADHDASFATARERAPYLLQTVMTHMNWTLVESNWTQFRGTVKARWLKLDDERLHTIAGQRAALLSAIQDVYGISRVEAEREIRAFEARNKNYRPK